MCGIAGIISYGAGALPPDPRELAAISARMAARGPDGSGHWTSPDGRASFTHRRLGIIDVSRNAAQPMASADGDLAITFNGEIYNHAQLRAGLAKKGARFRTRSDTEVVLRLYAQEGPAMVARLRGMFAFAIWDRRRRSVFLARDPYGIKPLYCCDTRGVFRFASQVKALLAGGGVSRQPDAAGWAGFAMFGNVPEPYTVYRDIKALPAGSTVTIDSRGARTPARYFNIAKTYCAAEDAHAPNSAHDQLECAKAAILDSVQHHLVADVPVGAFLSGGIDSGALVGAMRDAGQETIQTLTLRFEEFSGRREDEAPMAAEVARRYRTDHATRVVTAREFRDDLPAIFDAMDQPTIDGVNTWFAAKAARERGLKVAISGAGGDELFGGYSTFRTAPRAVRLLGIAARLPSLARPYRSAAETLTRLLGFPHAKAAGILDYGATLAGAVFLQRALFLPWRIHELLGDPDMVRAGLAELDPVAHMERSLDPLPRTAFARVATLEASHYLRNQLLRDADWAGMAHAVEIRTPLVDAELLRRVAPLTLANTGAGKRLLARCPATPLPASLLSRRKTGFGVPMTAWLADAGRNARPGGWAKAWAGRVAEQFTLPPADRLMPSLHWPDHVLSFRKASM